MKLLPAYLAFLVVTTLPAALTPEPAYFEGLRTIYELLNQESGLSKILMVKTTQPKVAERIKAISVFAAENSDQLEKLAKKEPDIFLSKPKFPDNEIRARKLTAKMTAQELLLDKSGEDYEVVLLQTQLSALRYLSTLARVVGDQDKNKERQKFLRTLEQEAENHHREVLKFLKVK